MSEDTREALAAWELAYAAFKGAFDTPQMRRQMPDEYSEDARKRMRDFDERIRAALATQPAAQPELKHSTTWSGDCPHWCKACAAERAERAAQPSAQGEAVARELLNRMLEAPTTHIRASWKDAIREALLKTSPTESVAWLVEWKANGHGPQWWGFNHTPGKNASWCSDSNNAIRFARKEDAERMRLHIIAVAGLTGVHDYERSVSVTEHMWEGHRRGA